MTLQYRKDGKTIEGGKQIMLGYHLKPCVVDETRCGLKDISPMLWQLLWCQRYFSKPNKTVLIAKRSH
jgi:hypothetical protein